MTQQDFSSSVGVLPPRQERRLWTAIAFWVLIGVATAGLVTGLAIGVLSTHGFTDSTPTMEPAIQPGDRIVAADGSAVRRGDIVVLHHPATSASIDDTYVLRVIGLAGDRVTCCDARGLVTVNGRPLDESYADTGGARARIAFSVRVRPGQIWVMGDNRAFSYDSREWGPVSSSGVVGRVILVGHGSSFTAQHTPRAFVTAGLAPADTRFGAYVWLAGLVTASAAALVILAVTGITVTLARWRRSRRLDPPPGLAE